MGNPCWPQWQYTTSQKRGSMPFMKKIGGKAHLPWSLLKWHCGFGSCCIWQAWIQLPCQVQIQTLALLGLQITGHVTIVILLTSSPLERIPCFMWRHHQHNFSILLLIFFILVPWHLNFFPLEYKTYWIPKFRTHSQPSCKEGRIIICTRNSSRNCATNLQL